MIEHISLRCRNSRSSRKFYEKALAPLVYQVDREYGDSYGFIQAASRLLVTKGKVGTPIHLAFHADATSAVDRFTARRSRREARQRRARNARRVRIRAFVLDPDGHNVEAVIWNEDLGRASPRLWSPEAEARPEIAWLTAAPEWRQGFIAHVRPGGVSPTTRYGYWPQPRTEGAMSLRINDEPQLHCADDPGSDRLPPWIASVGILFSHPRIYPGVHHRAGYMARIKPSSTSAHQDHRLERGLGGGPQRWSTTSRDPGAAPTTR